MFEKNCMVNGNIMLDWSVFAVELINRVYNENGSLRNMGR